MGNYDYDYTKIKTGDYNYDYTKFGKADYDYNNHCNRLQMITITIRRWRPMYASKGVARGLSRLPAPPLQKIYQKFDSPGRNFKLLGSPPY